MVSDKYLVDDQDIKQPSKKFIDWRTYPSFDLPDPRESKKDIIVLRDNGRPYAAIVSLEVAALEVNRRCRQDENKSAERSKQPWDLSENLHFDDPNKSDEEIAEVTKRTLGAVQSQRRKWEFSISRSVVNSLISKFEKRAEKYKDCDDVVTFRDTYLFIVDILKDLFVKSDILRNQKK